MTREEAIKRVKGYLTDCLPTDCYEEIEEIIKVLEQGDIQKAYNKGVDDFMKSIICGIRNKYPDMPIVDIFGSREKWKEKNSQYLECENLAYKIAEQLKCGGR